MSYRRYDFSNIGENMVSRLHPHPLNDKIYGSAEPDANLLRSVAEHGVFNPIVINRRKEILSGTRRWAAAKAAGFKKIPVLILLEDEAGLLSELFLIESNRQRIKTKGQIAREAAELMRIEKALAAERQKATLKKGKETPVPPSKGVSEGEARDIVAEKLGQSKNTVEKEVAIVQAAEKGNPQAQEALVKLDRNETSVSEAYKSATNKAKKNVTAQEATVRELNAIFQKSKIEAVVSRAKVDGTFHILVHNMTYSQIKRLHCFLEGEK